MNTTKLLPIVMLVGALSAQAQAPAGAGGAAAPAAAAGPAAAAPAAQPAYPGLGVGPAAAVPGARVPGAGIPGTVIPGASVPGSTAPGGAVAPSIVSTPGANNAVTAAAPGAAAPQSQPYPSAQAARLPQDQPRVAPLATQPNVPGARSPAIDPNTQQPVGAQAAGANGQASGQAQTAGGQAVDANGNVVANSAQNGANGQALGANGQALGAQGLGTTGQQQALGADGQPIPNDPTLGAAGLAANGQPLVGAGQSGVAQEQGTQGGLTPGQGQGAYPNDGRGSTWGPLAREIAVNSVLAGAAAQIDACTSRYAAEFPARTGQATIHVRVLDSGRVTDTRVDTTLASSDRLRACLSSVGELWRFERGPFELSLPVNVAPGAKLTLAAPGSAGSYAGSGQAAPAGAMASNGAQVPVGGGTVNGAIAPNTTAGNAAGIEVASPSSDLGMPIDAPGATAPGAGVGPLTSTGFPTDSGWSPWASNAGLPGPLSDER